MKIGVFTYDMPHRKTYDTLCLLKARGYQDIYIYGMPIKYKKKFAPLIEHRPSLPDGIISDIRVFCQNLGYSYKKLELGYEDVDLEVGSVILVCGAGIIPQKVIDKYTIINSHPGYIPNVRGLDALKWAVFEGEPIGVTTHLLGDVVDAGRVIERKEVELCENDTFHTVAQRQYEMEIKMLVDAIEKVDDELLYVSEGDFVLHKRMGHSYEMELYDKFQKYLNKKLSEVN